MRSIWYSLLQGEEVSVGLKTIYDDTVYHNPVHWDVIDYSGPYYEDYLEYYDPQGYEYCHPEAIVAKIIRNFLNNKLSTALSGLREKIILEHFSDFELEKLPINLSLRERKKVLKFFASIPYISKYDGIDLNLSEFLEDGFYDNQGNRVLYPNSRIQNLSLLAQEMGFLKEAIALGINSGEPLYCFTELEKESKSATAWDGLKAQLKNQARTKIFGLIKLSTASFYESWIPFADRSKNDYSKNACRSVNFPKDLETTLLMKEVLGNPETYSSLEMQSIFYGMCGVEHNIEKLDSLADMGSKYASWMLGDMSRLHMWNNSEAPLDGDVKYNKKTKGFSPSISVIISYVDEIIVSKYSEN